MYVSGSYFIFLKKSHGMRSAGERGCHAKKETICTNHVARLGERCSPEHFEISLGSPHQTFATRWSQGNHRNRTCHSDEFPEQFRGILTLASSWNYRRCINTIHPSDQTATARSFPSSFVFIFSLNVGGLVAFRLLSSSFYFGFC